MSWSCCGAAGADVRIITWNMALNDPQFSRPAFMTRPGTTYSDSVLTWRSFRRPSTGMGSVAGTAGFRTVRYLESVIFSPGIGSNRTACR